MQNTTFSIITAKIIQQYIEKNINKIYSLIKKTYLTHEVGQTINPNSYFMTFPDKPKARIIALPAAITDENPISGLKWIASNPENCRYQLPRASAVIILNDYDTGFPIACLEGAAISATRTAYSAVLAAEYMCRTKVIDSIGLIGNSYIAMNVYKAFNHLGWKINQLNLYDISEKKSKEFLSMIPNNSYSQAEIYGSAETLISSSELVVLATTAAVPYIDDEKSFSHNPTVLNISLRDLSPEILLHSHNIVDDIAHVLNANTSPDLAYKRYGHHKFIDGTLAQLMQNECLISNNKPRIFSPMGLGVLDVAIAHDVLQNATESTPIKDFFASSACELP